MVRGWMIWAAVGQFDGVQVVQLVDLHGVGEDLGVGVQNAVHILPDRHRFGPQDVGDHGGRVVRTLAAQRGRGAVGGAADEALPDEDGFGRRLHLGPQQGRGGLDVDRGVLVTQFGAEAAAHVDPAVRDAHAVEEFGDDGRGDQLAVGDDRVVPQLGLLAPVVALRGDLLQLRKEPLDRRQGRRLAPEVGHDLVVVAAQFGDLLRRGLAVAQLQPAEYALQRVGGLAHGRDDDEQMLLVADDLVQVADSVGIPDRRSAEFVNFHIVFFRCYFSVPTSR